MLQSQQHLFSFFHFFFHRNDVMCRLHYDVIYHPFAINSQYLRTWGVDITVVDLVRSLQCRCSILGWPKLVHVRIVVAAIFGFMTEKYLVVFYVFRTPVYIWTFWNRIARYTHFILSWTSSEISESSFFDYEPQISVSSTTSKWKIQPNTQNTVDGKEVLFHIVRWLKAQIYTERTKAQNFAWL